MFQTPILAQVSWSLKFGAPLELGAWSLEFGVSPQGRSLEFGAFSPAMIVVFDLGKVLVDFDYSKAAGSKTSAIHSLHVFIGSALIHAWV